MTTLEPHKCGGSSLPSLHEIIALQNSYSGRHSPERHGNVFSGHFLDLRKSQFSSSSPVTIHIIKDSRRSTEFYRQGIEIFHRKAQLLKRISHFVCIWTIALDTELFHSHNSALRTSILHRIHPNDYKLSKNLSKVFRFTYATIWPSIANEEPTNANPRWATLWERKRIK